MHNHFLVNRMVMKFSRFDIFVIVVLISEVELRLNSSRTAEILQSYKGQKLNLAPRKKGESVKVGVAAVINNMVPLNFINEHIFVEMDLAMKWRDERLSFRSQSPDDLIVLQNNDAIFFWRPDIILDGEKGVKHETFPESYSTAWIYPDGQIMYFTKISVTVYCLMKYAMFPFDKQTCSLRFESWSYNVQQLSLEFFNMSQGSSVSIGDSFRIAKFVLEKYQAVKLSIDYGVSGVFDQLKVIFFFKRDIRFYIMEFYFPIICIVTLSFVSFWISFKATPARVALPVTTFLTLTKMLEHVRASATLYGTADALEVFLNTSIIFVFGVMFQYGVVGITAKSWSKRNSERKKILQKRNECKNDSGTGIFAPLKKIKALLVKKHQKREDRVHLLDIICRYCFPLSYFVFIIIYGTICFLHLSR